MLRFFSMQPYVIKNIFTRKKYTNNKYSLRTIINEKHGLIKNIKDIVIVSRNIKSLIRKIIGNFLDIF